MGNNLPPLPPIDPKMQIGYEAIRYVAGYTEKYLKDYARLYADEAVKQEREAIAAMCQATQHEYYDAGGSLLLNTPQRLAAAIRARSEP